ncbi:MAG: 1,2-dihydroxy-3-keto-5-methylthiopentene dioxygenase [Methylococcaceae bacterium]|jgi:1,2-dihydroxy-3-keto-5-methylthiopentene dioxygenase
MSLLSIHPDTQPAQAVVFNDHAQIADELARVGILFERWVANRPLSKEARQDEVLEAYRVEVDRLIDQYEFQSSDVVSLTPDHPQKDQFRARFLNEHTHDEFEVRFFVEGRGLFYLHVDERVHIVLCEQGDLISVPAGVKHWFDMGAAPDFKCIRLFTNPEGWVAHFTGNDIASRFPDFERYLSCYL